MKRNNAQSVDEIIKQYLEAEHLDGRIYEQRLLAIWPEIVGGTINRYTLSRYVKDSVLYIHMSSAAARNEIMLYRSSLLRALNDAVGKTVINDIKLV